MELSMLYRVFLGAAVFLAGCGKALSTPVNTRTAGSPDDTFECVKKQLGALGYRQSSNDASEQRVAATKIDNKSRRPDVQFRRILDKLDIDVSATAEGQTSIEVLPRTFADYTTQRGPTEVQERASELVKADAQTLLDRCRS
jgi:hypothetical protein